jgi:hypothetical protein
MAVYVLLSFPDDAGAKDFVKTVVRRGQVQVVNERTSTWSVTADVLAAIKRPTQFCHCTGDGPGRHKMSYTQGKKYGWWVHAVCGKPAIAWQHPRTDELSLGFNLLPDELLEEPKKRTRHATAEWTLEDLGVQRAEAEMPSVSEPIEDGSDTGGASL